jgi:hypothetical protein
MMFVALIVEKTKVDSREQQREIPRPGVARGFMEVYKSETDYAACDRNRNYLLRQAVLTSPFRIIRPKEQNVG